MNELILHHHDPSPYAEKIRKIFGLKQLAWQSVQVSMVMPRPEMTSLTGGYRKIPILQIGADIYCDSLLIAQILDQLHPDPPLFPSGLMTNLAVQNWGDAMFRVGAPLAMHENAGNLPAEVIEDRRAYFTFLDFDKFADNAPHFRSQFRAKATLLDAQLADGRPYLLGDSPEWADINAFFNIWMAGGHIPSAQNMFAPLQNMANWYKRIEALGQGTRTDIDATQAIESARQATPHAHALTHALTQIDTQQADMQQANKQQKSLADESGLSIGQNVIVTADDYGKDPIAGKLHLINDWEIVISREEAQIGELAVHFPRMGFSLTAA